MIIQQHTHTHTHTHTHLKYAGLWLSVIESRPCDAFRHESSGAGSAAIRANSASAAMADGSSC